MSEFSEFNDISSNSRVSVEAAQSPEWLSKLFKKTVTDVVVVDLSEAGGLNAIMRKLILTFEDGTTLAVILKCFGESAYPRSKTLNLSRESYFYSLLANELDIDVPKIYHAYGNSTTGEKVILLENLSDCIQSGYFFGPHSCLNWGKDLAKLTESVPNVREVDIAEKAFKAGAKYHAKHWNDASLKSYEWLRSTNWYNGKDQESWQASQQMAVDAWKKVRGPDSNCGVVWNEYLVQIIESSLSKISWDTFVDVWVTNNHSYTLVHGDFHPANMMYQPTTDKVIILDWEQVGIGSGPQDLAQYMISHTNRAVRKELETKLLATYYDELIKLSTNKNLATEFTFEECRLDYIFGGAERWFWLLIYICQMGLPTVVLQYFHDIVSQFVNDYADVITVDSVHMPRT